MPQGLALEFSGVTKRFGAIAAVSDFSAKVESGRVTGFLGPNGAGKTTSLRILLGLVRPTAGGATIGGVPYAKLDRPLQTVGAVLEASSFHPGRTAANHLAVYAQAARIPRSRVDDVLGLVGLADAADRKIGGFSLGMRQRLGLAYALLGDPGILVLDEPANGLDPEGIKWMRGFLRQLAREGRTVLTSSHLLAEVQQTVDSLLIISHGRLVFEGGLDELTDPSEYVTVVDAPDREALIRALTAAGVSFEVLRSGLTVRGLEPTDVGAIAASGGVALSSLQRRGPALEEVFLELVDGTRTHPSMSGVHPAVVAAAAVAARPEPGVAEPEAAAMEPEPETVEPDAVAVEPEPEAVEPETVAAEPEAVVAGAIAAQAAAEEEAPGERPAETAASEAAADAAQTADDAPAPDVHQPPAGFVVASTGVIDVVAADEAESAGDTPDAEPAVADDASAPEAQAPEPEPAPDQPDDVPDDDDIDGDGVLDSPPTGPSDSDRPWDDYVKTDSDLEADAFFAAFDSEGEEGDSGADAVPDEAPAAESPDAERQEGPLEESEPSDAPPDDSPDGSPDDSDDEQHGGENEGDEQR